MTRFARAKGSKSSNERLPEQATSWSEMKQQLLEKNKEIEESKSRKHAIDQRNANYKAFLDKKEEDDRKHSKWADFPEVSKPIISKKKAKIVNKNSIKTQGNKSFEVKEQNPSKDDAFMQLTDKVDNILDNKNVSKIESDSDDAPPEEESSKKVITEPVIKLKKTKKKLLKILVDKGDSKNLKSNHEENDTLKKKKRKSHENEENDKTKKRKLTEEIVNGDTKDIIKNKKKQKNKKNSTEVKPVKKIIKENLTEKDLKKIEKKKQKRIKQLEKKKRVKAELKQQKEEQSKNGQEKEPNGETHDKTQVNSVNRSGMNGTLSKERFNISSNFNKEKKAKLKDTEKPPRRKPLLPHKMFINGKELEVDYVDGFPVKKEDAVRLKKLRREMISKGLPRSEINAALKLERRRAEKAFANEKKKVCFHCRKSGHNLSDCPELNKNQIVQSPGSGICFKCGSTEHTHFECKVVRGQEYKFAQCFICNEQGHIARQCPDNARGLYPKGGACNMCGDVTHLKKDCPQYQAQQQRQEESLRIETFGKSNPDVLEEKNDELSRTLNNKRSNKIIKF